MFKRFFAIIFCISMGSVGLVANNLNSKNLMFFQKLSVLWCIEDTYLLSLVMTLLVSVTAYFFLYLLCSQMTQFEFQPDQKIMDQFICMHTLVLTGLNQSVNP